MTRTQVQLTDEQIRKLKRISADSGKSIAELVRLGVELYLASNQVSNRQAIKDRARRAVGRFRSGLSDIGQNHDKYLAEDFLK